MRKILALLAVCAIITGCAEPSDKDMAEIAREHKTIILHDEEGNRYSAQNHGGDLWVLLKTSNEEKKESGERR